LKRELKDLEESMEDALAKKDAQVRAAALAQHKTYDELVEVTRRAKRAEAGAARATHINEELRHKLTQLADYVDQTSGELHTTQAVLQSTEASLDESMAALKKLERDSKAGLQAHEEELHKTKFELARNQSLLADAKSELERTRGDYEEQRRMQQSELLEARSELAASRRQPDVGQWQAVSDWDTEGKIYRVDPDFGSTLTVSNRDYQSNCWVKWKIMGQPCEFQVPVGGVRSHRAPRVDATSRRDHHRPTDKRCSIGHRFHHRHHDLPPDPAGSRVGHLVVRDSKIC
jgi:hypothetical protein